MDSSDSVRSDLPQDSRLDIEALRRLQETLGDQAALMIPELIEDFFKDSVRQVTAARAALEQKNASELRRSAHSLKSNAATFGAATLSTVAKELEGLAKQEIFNDVASDLIDRTARELETIKPLLEQYRKGL